MNKEKIGVGISTRNRIDFFIECLKSIDSDIVDEIVVVNDGEELDETATELIKNKDAFYIKNEKNLGVAKTKNKALKYLLEKNCEHIFMIEDDCVISNNQVWDLYIRGYKETNIPHFNYGPGSPWNRKQSRPDLIGNLSLRHLAEQTTSPIPKLVVSYKTINLALYEHIVAMFCYFNSSILREVGLYDETFFNAWEHVEHTYRIIKIGKYTPFWWFADIENSHLYIKEAKDEKGKSTLAENEKKFMENTINGLQHFYNIHGVVPSTIRPSNQETVVQTLKKIYNS